MSKLIINGGKTLKGSVTPVPNKNSILTLIPAALLTDEDVILHNVPSTTDVKYMLETLKLLGWTYARSDNNTSVTINCSQVKSWILDPDLSEKMKANVLFSWPLLHRFKKVSMPTPQGCKLGTRPIDVLLDNMESMNAQYKKNEGIYEVTTNGLKGNKIRQWFPSVTGTENLILMAVMAEGTTELYNAACEPHTQDLCNMLVSMGAKIEGIGSNKLIIQGVTSLTGTEWTVVSDHLDVAGLIVAAAMTNGDILIRNACTQHMWLIVQMVNKLGVFPVVDENADTIHIGPNQPLVIHKTIKGNPRRTHALHRPLLPPDIVHAMVVLALKADGQAIFDNLFYEYGFFFVQELAKMKANVILANPVTIITTGSTQFKAADLMCSDIIQASYGLLMAALAAPGISTLNSITPLFRRFPNFVEQFNSLGADLQLIGE